MTTETEHISACMYSKGAVTVFYAFHFSIVEIIVKLECRYCTLVSQDIKAIQTIPLPGYKIETVCTYLLFLAY